MPKLGIVHVQSNEHINLPHSFKNLYGRAAIKSKWTKVWNEFDAIKHDKMRFSF